MGRKKREEKRKIKQKGIVVGVLNEHNTNTKGPKKMCICGQNARYNNSRV